MRKISQIDDLELINLFEKARTYDILLSSLRVIGIYLLFKLLFYLNIIYAWTIVILLCLSIIILPSSQNIKIYERELYKRGLIDTLSIYSK